MKQLVMSILVLGSLALCSSLVGCNSGSSSVSETIEPDKLPPLDQKNGCFKDAIVGGQPVALDNPRAKHVVLLWNQNNEKTDICTGVLISQNVILTAAHCMDNGTENILAIFHNSMMCSRGMNFDKIRMAQKVVIHPQWTGKVDNRIDPTKEEMTANYDLALVQLRQPAPSQYQPASLWSSADLGASSELTQIGFGRIASTSQTVPELREVGKNSTQMARETKLNYVMINQLDGHGGCEGDSGGPLLIKNQSGDYKIVGIASFLISGKGEKNFCEKSLMFYNDTELYKDWILENLDKLK